MSKEIKNQELQIVDYGMNGVGIAHGQKTYFLPNVLLGEKVSLDANNQLRVLLSSPNRVQTLCPYYAKCGGCNLQCMNSEEQQKYKTTYVGNCLKKYKVNYDKDFEYVCSSNLYYRNKISFAVRNINGKNVIGLFESKSHNVIPVKECLITDQRHKKILDIFREYLKLDIKCYSDIDKQGIRNVVVRFTTEAVLVCVVGTVKQLPQSQALTKFLANAFTKFNLSYCQNKDPKTILSRDIKFVSGKQDISITRDNLTIPINIGSFLQINDEVSSQIYNYVRTVLPKDSIVFDLYSGAGLMTAVLARSSAFCIGVECNPHAVNLSNALFKQNNIQNAYAILGKSEEVLPKLLKDIASEKLSYQGRLLTTLKHNQNLCCVLDPPRKGCAQSLLDEVLKNDIQTIVYVSCQPITLARDLAVLTRGYSINSIKLFDMFYLTSHVETVVVLTKDKNA